LHLEGKKAILQPESENDLGIIKNRGNKAWRNITTTKGESSKKREVKTKGE